MAEHIVGDVLVLACRDCGDDRVFAPVDCVDSHDECPERACVDCGAAVLLATWLPVSQPRAGTSRLLAEALGPDSDLLVDAGLSRSVRAGAPPRAARLVG